MLPQFSALESKRADKLRVSTKRLLLISGLQQPRGERVGKTTLLLGLYGLTSGKDRRLLTFRLVTRRDNLLNTRHNHNITWNGTTLTVSEWADVLGITQSSLADRLRSGVPMEKVMKPGNQRKEDAILELNGERLTVTEWADRLNINKQTLYARVYAGWTDEKALTTPTRKKSPSKKDTAT